MATAVARTVDIADGFDAGAPVQATTRTQALDLMMAGQSATHDQGVDARIYRAASGLIEGHRAGRKVDIEAYGYPFDVLENVAAQLQSIGASHFVTAQVMGALQDYILNMGSDFSRAAKAKPLYARIMVTNKAPDDLPECEQTQAALLDGVRKIGGEAARIMVQNTVFGTKSTTSQGVDLDQMFASNNNGLFVFFGSPQNMGVQGFDSADAALVNLAQGMAGGVGGGAGGAMAQAVEQIKEAIKNGDVTPQVLKLIETLATLAQTGDAMKTPGAVGNAPAQMTDIIRDITAQIQSGVADGALPPAIIEGTVAVIAALQSNDLLTSIIASPGGAETLIADNDNLGADNDNQPVALDVPVISDQAAADIAAVIATLQQSETLPPELAEAVASMAAQTLGAAEVKQALEGNSEMAATVQAIVAMLADPAVQAQLPPAVQAPVQTAMMAHSDVAQNAVTQTIVRAVENAVKAAPADTASVMQAAQIVRDLKDGVQTIRTLDAPKLAVMAAALTDAAPKQPVQAVPVAAALRAMMPAVSAPATPSYVAPVAPRTSQTSSSAPSTAAPSSRSTAPAQPTNNNPPPPPRPLTINQAPVSPPHTEAGRVEKPASPPPPLPRETRNILESVVKNPAVKPAVAQAIHAALKANDNAALVQAIKQDPTIIETLPPDRRVQVIRDIASQLTPPAYNRQYEVNPPPPIPADVAKGLARIVNNTSVPAEVSIAVQEAINSGDARKVQQIFEQSPDVARLITPEMRSAVETVIQQPPTRHDIGGDRTDWSFQKPAPAGGCGDCSGDRGCCKPFTEAQAQNNEIKTKEFVSKIDVSALRPATP